MFRLMRRPFLCCLFYAELYPLGPLHFLEIFSRLWVFIKTGVHIVVTKSYQNRSMLMRCLVVVDFSSVLQRVYLRFLFLDAEMVHRLDAFQSVSRLRRQVGQGGISIIPRSTLYYFGSICITCLTSCVSCPLLPLSPRRYNSSSITRTHVLFLFLTAVLSLDNDLLIRALKPR
jgi:hypothetical protein